MAYLLDTNILVRLADRGGHESRLATRAVKTLLRQGESLNVLAQNLIEFWTVATRPESTNGLGMSPETALDYSLHFESAFQPLDELPGIYEEWRGLVSSHRVVGIASYDARIVAAMILHGIDKILTFDPAHFRRYSEVEVVEPPNVS